MKAINETKKIGSDRKIPNVTAEQLEMKATNETKKIGSDRKIPKGRYISS